MEGRAKEPKGIEYYMGLPYSILLHEIEEDGEKYWIAEVPELPGCKSHGSSVEEAVNSVEEAKKDWILDSLKTGEEVPIPLEREKYSGRMLVRMSRSLHRSLAIIAEAEKLSLNQLIVTMLAKEVGRINVLNRVEDKVDNLLQKINHVLEGESIRMPLSKWLRLIRQPQEQEEYVLSDLGLFSEDLIADATNVEAIAPGVVTTGSPFEGLLNFQRSFQYPGQKRLVYSAEDVTEENTITTEHK